MLLKSFRLSIWNYWNWFLKNIFEKITQEPPSQKIWQSCVGVLPISSNQSLWENSPGGTEPGQVSQKPPFWTFWPAKSSTTLFEKIPQGESSLAKFLKNLLFWTFWPAKSSKTTLFEKIHQDLDGSSPNVLVCLYRSSPRWRASTDWSLQPLNLMFLRNLRISTSWHAYFGGFRSNSAVTSREVVII